MKDDQLIIDYLLGKLSPEEEHRLAERYFVDDRLFDRLQQVENELLDLYVRGRLGQEGRAGFEHYLAIHPEGKYKVALTKALMQLSASERGHSESVLKKEAPLLWWMSVMASPERQNTPLRWAVAAGLAVILLSVGYIVYQRYQIREARDEINGLRATEEALRQKIAEEETEIAVSKAIKPGEEKTPQPEQVPTLQPPQSPHEPKTQHTVANIIFNLPVRGSGTETLQLTRETKSVSATIILDHYETYPQYRVKLLSVSGATVVSPRDFSAKTVESRRILNFAIEEPMRLTESKYYLNVSAIEEGKEVPGTTRTLPFKVVRKM